MGSAMNITFRPVTRENFSAVIELTVTPEQADFVSPNLYSLAEAYDRTNLDAAGDLRRG